MANIKSEQLRSDLSLELDYDQPLSNSRIIEMLTNLLGKEKTYTEKFDNKNVFCYQSNEKTEVLLLASITYMGGTGQHPVYKKRTQLKKWYKEAVEHYEKDKNYNVRFIGVYHYKNNIIFADFIKDTYLNKKMNSSAAHVYTNDLYQAMKEGVFKRIDRNNNIIKTIKFTKFKDYLNNNTLEGENSLFALFSMFNNELTTNKWLTAERAIVEMHKGGWNHWKETEWPGWFLEFKMNSFIEEYSLENKIKYIGSSSLSKNMLDFDLWFDEEKFYGDLKASDSAARETPGNDQENFMDSINKYDKFWYIIYEHDTIKDKDTNDFEATRFRTKYIKDNNEWPKNKPWDELSYSKRMKNSVKFIKMYIIELNRVNYREVLSDFNQGKQPDGSKRKPKFKITKNNIDNFLVFQENFIEIE